MKVLVADKMADTGIQRLKELGCDVVLKPDLEGVALGQAVQDLQSHTLIVRSTKVPRATLEAGTELKLVIRAGSGYDTIDVAAATERDIRVCNCPGMNSVAVAELAIGLMIALDRQIVDETDDLRRGIWNKKQYSKHALGLKGRTLGIVGMGRIGCEVAKRAAAFEMKLLYADTIDRSEVERELGIHKVSMEDLLQQSDFVTLHVPGGEETRHLIGEAEFARMKPTAYLLNCARGGVVDEKALAAALESGKIAGAALDVYEIEPAASDHKFEDPIRNEPHVYGTHHVGASTAQAQDAVADETVRIVKEYMDRGEFLHCVNPAE